MNMMKFSGYYISRSPVAMFDETKVSLLYWFFIGISLEVFHTQKFHFYPLTPEFNFLYNMISVLYLCQIINLALLLFLTTT